MAYQDGDFFRPRKYFVGGIPNPIAELGECGDMKCAVCRRHAVGMEVRRAFLEYCLEQITQVAAENPQDGIILCSFGPGCLYFDWELLERLVNQRGIPIRQVWLVEKEYEPGSEFRDQVIRARDCFASWFADAGFEIHAFSSAASLQDWVHAFPEAGRANVFLQCDVTPDDTEGVFENNTEFCETVCTDDAINMQIYTQVWPDDGAVTPLRTFWRRNVGNKQEFKLVEAQSWRNGEWNLEYQHAIHIRPADMWQQAVSKIIEMRLAGVAQE